MISEEMPWIAEPDQLQVLGFGFRSVAVETASGEVVLIGKVAETAASYARIFRLAPHLDRRLPVSIPQPTWYLPASDRLSGGALCYPKLPGRSLEKADIEGPVRQQIIAALAGFLRALHRIPVELALAFDVPAVDRAAWAGTVEAVLPTLRRALMPQEYGLIDDW
jgi:aminoglycoside phosphotransferase (APT) family kinase protein